MHSLRRSPHSPTLPFAFIILLVIFASASCAPALEPPSLKARVNDNAAILSPSTEAQLEQVLGNLEKTDSTQIAVLTIPTLDGENLEQFSLKVAETWQLGTADFDNGALLLIAVKERKIRIEVGYGLEGRLTDLVAGRIIRNDILPHFKNGNYNQGIVAGVDGMVQAVKGEYSGRERTTTKDSEDPFGLFAMMMFFFFFLGNVFVGKKIACAVLGGIGAPVLGIIFAGPSLPLILALIPTGIVLGLIFSKLLGSGRKSGSSSTPYISGGFGSSSGGFGGFSGGGGGFGGGGASGGW